MVVWFVHKHRNPTLIVSVTFSILSRSPVVMPTRIENTHKKGKKSKLAFMHDLLAARLRRQAWQRGGGAKLDSAAAPLGLAARLHSTASLGHGRASRHQCRAATARLRCGDEDTGGSSNCGGTNNQQSTKRTDTTTMTVTRITIETKGTAVAAEAR